MEGNFMSKHIYVICLLLFLLCSICFADQTTYTLENDVWTIQIASKSLEIIAKPNGQTPIQIAAPQENLGEITDVKQIKDGISWELPKRGISVSFQLSDNSLSISFVSNSTGDFTWPIVSYTPTIQGYVLPLFEGSYVPADDLEWQTFLVERSPMNTTEGLSMTFWGLDCGDYTLTYILTNPFNNELAFEKNNDGLIIRLSHQFTRNWKKKTYGLVIRLGNASPVEPAKQYRQWLIDQGEFVSMKEKVRATPEAEKLLGAAHIYLWGDGVSVKMIENFAENGFDRLWLGLDSWTDGFQHPQAIAKAKELGYLIAPYDSYHSIHHPNEPDTWETAQFDLNLYETGAIVKANGTKERGFKKKGYKLSPIAARPYVEKRVNGIMSILPFNSWFVDCDAYGEVFDDYSELHPATQLDDVNARMDRIAWIRDKYKAVVGSEGGVAYSASTIHFAHGMMTPVIGWDDPDLKDKSSPYYLGRYWPPDGPEVFIKQVQLKPKYFRFYYDPQFRVPLYQTVFHDSVAATHQWGYASLKFKDQVDTVALLELLYNVPPLYHINLKEFEKHKKWMKAYYDFFSPLHRITGLQPMTDFSWLTSDRMVQRTVFGDVVEMIANFSFTDYEYQGTVVPKRSILAKWYKTGETKVFTPMSQ